ncbi:MAG TPA: hypothetical protein ENN80_10675, partial [Candidatus Hydrogenedentes bacterium]|nr:hypothetical protein [Candidatus Hydrogenedentota bacterium]
MSCLRHLSRFGVKGLAAVVLGLLMTSVACADVPPASVVLVVIDTLRADRIHAERNGIPVMPKLAAFAAETIEFSSALSQESWTKPSMVSIFTALYPSTHRVQFGIQRKMIEGQALVAEGVPDGLEMMATYFKKAGYHTVGVQTNHQLKGEHGFNQGFDSYRLDRTALAADVTDQAIEQLTHLRAPFFLYAHYLDPHLPYEPPEPY